MLTTGPAPLSLDGAEVGHGLPRRAIPLRELRAILLHPGTGRATRDAAWGHIVEAAHTGTPAWVIGAVGLALPALWRMAGDLAGGYRGDVEDLHAAMLAGFVAALHRVDTGRPGVITRLRWAAYRAGLLARYTRQGIPPMPLPALESAPPPQPWGHPDLLLADAVAKSGLVPVGDAAPRSAAVPKPESGPASRAGHRPAGVRGPIHRIGRHIRLAPPAHGRRSLLRPRTPALDRTGVPSAA